METEFMSQNENKICKRCILPEARPEIWFNEEGLCNICVEYDKAQGVHQDRPEKLLETDLVKLLNKYKGKGDYDCLVMCSGGKDSTAALYYMVTKYKMKCLAFTFDNGFETPEALRNVKKATDKLGCDFLYYKTDYMKQMFSDILKSGSKTVLCHPCSIWYIDLSYKMASRYNIPLIVAGWTKGQSTKQEMMTKCGCNINQPEFVKMGQATQDFFTQYLKNNDKYKDFPKSMKEVQERAKKNSKAIVISPHWFLQSGPEEYVEIIKEKLGWDYPKLSYPGRSTNCKLNFVSVYNSMKYYGYTHYHVEMSKLIRENVLTREEALKDLDLKLHNVNSGVLNSIAEKLDYQFEEL